ncbi:MAG: sigma-E processing peptidase SpoIIGA [Lachnospiraceae bacterium]
MLQVTVYLDIVFLINFIADFYVLFITGKVVKQKISCLRILAGALFGASMLLPCILYPKMLTGCTGIMLCTGISMGAVLISLGKRGGFIKKWFLSTTIMVLLGGMINYLRYMTGTTTIKLCIWIFFFAGSGIIGMFMISFLQKMVHKGKHVYQIYIKHEGKRMQGNVYLDTGNMLWDALFGKPVVLLSEGFVLNLMSEEERLFIEEYKKKGYMDYNSQTLLNAQKKVCFHEIAYQSVGKSSGKLLCFLLEEMELPENRIILRRQPAAIADSSLFEGKEYQGLLFSDGI